MRVRFLDFSKQMQKVKREVDNGLKEVFRKGDFILGEEAERFENEFAKFCGVKYGVGVNSGTDALYLALGALDITVGDEVIVPAFTFIATALCISYTGAKPVFVDIEEETYNIDPDKLTQAINKNTKVILPVHLYGQPANMKEINSIAKKNNITVIEDACQAHGSAYKGKRAGSLGQIGCFSFYPTKSLGACGDAGMVVTNDKKVYDGVRMLRDYGRVDRYNHKVKGYNSRLDTIQAVVLSAKLKYLDEWNKMRQDLAAYYCKLLKDAEGIVTPITKEDRTHVFQTFAIRIKNREKVMKGMKEKGVDVLIHYPIPLHLQEAYSELGHKIGDFPVSEAVSGDILSLPMYPHMKKEEVKYVCDCLKELINE